MSPSGNRKLGEFWQILYRNVFLLTNGIVFSVVALLFAFGQFRAGTFLGIISLANICFGLSQDINAWLSLEKQRRPTAPRVVRVGGGGARSSVLAEEIEKGDLIALKIGDQVPCDSFLTDALGFEVNEGLITGESSSLVKQVGDH